MVLYTRSMDALAPGNIQRSRLDNGLCHDLLDRDILTFEFRYLLP